MSEVPAKFDVAVMVKRLRVSPLFDPAWYLERYPDVGALGMDPAEHYVVVGAALNRLPGPGFDPETYLRDNSEAASSGLPPLLHLLERQNHLRTRFKGYLDRLTESGVSGWAVDTENPDRPVPLQLFINDRLVAEFSTTTPRADVSAIGLRAQSAGFEYGWRPGATPSGAQIDVRVRESGESLGKSPRVAPVVQAALSGSSYYDLHEAGVMRPVRVVVPVFNAYDAVMDCLASLQAHCPEYAAILLVNDGSTDPRIPKLLARFAADDRFTVLDNGSNLGYTRSINRAIASCPEEDVVLLNSDTKVTRRWLDNLRYCAYAGARHGTVTALSNNAGAFSVPVIGKCNDVPEHLSDDQFAAIVAHAGIGVPVEVPTANGFCMYIRRDMLRQIGGFDEARYPRGYGEENDLSMRALRAGWKNIVCDKALVFHKRSQSFGGEKEALMRAGAEQLRALYPEYKGMVSRFRDLEFTLLRSRISDAIGASPSSAASPRILFVISTQTGGTPQTNLDLMRSLAGSYGCFLLRSDAKTLTFSELVDGKLVEREVVALSRRIDPESHVSDEYNRVVCGMMYRHSISLLHIRHLLWHGLDLPRVAKSMNIPVIYSLHDFYSVCASHNLLDEKLMYCGGRCTPGPGPCQSVVWPNGAPDNLKHGFVHHWRAMFNRVYESCDGFVTTAPSAARILVDNYAVLDGKITVIPHGRDFEEFTDLVSVPSAGESLRVLVPGNVGPSKGSGLIREMDEHDAGKNVEFHLLGAVSRDLAGVGIQHGKYNRSSFAAFVEKIRPSVGMILSIWPETYCHTLTEMWSCGIPVLAMDIGAVGDRIRASGAGWLIPVDSSPELILAKLRSIQENSADFENRVLEVKAWQAAEGMQNTVGAMSARYTALYRSLLKATAQYQLDS